MRWLFAIAVLAPGCFYVDPINERPSAEIRRDDPSVPLVRGGAAVHVSAVWSDPNGDPVTFAWTVTGCLADGVTCNHPIGTGTTEVLPIAVPASGDIAKVRVKLDVTDSHGAVERPAQELVLDVTDQAPTLALFADGPLWNQAHPVHLPITVFATTSDPDNDAVTLAWDPPYVAGTDPQQSAWTIVSDTVRRFTPDVDGDWAIRVVATDDHGLSVEKPMIIHVEADQPPCLGLAAPAFDTVIDQSTRFAVLTVDDDLDAYPTPALDPIGFHWSIRSPHTGGAWQALGTDESSVVIDPQLEGYAKGDAIDLRVEITDDTARPPLPCDPSIDTCSLDGTSCLQRQTWHAEVR